MKQFRNILLLLLISTGISAQQLNDAKQAVYDLLEPLAEKQLIRQDYSELLNDLIYLYEHPLNLNTVTKEDLERIPFLDDYQIENILFYVYNNGPLLTIYELNAVKNLPTETIKQIVPFLIVEPVSTVSRPKRVKIEAILRGRTTVQKPSGFLPPNDTTPAPYSGSRERIYTRIQASYGTHLFAGFTMEKDPGEPAFSKEIPFMDFMSGYVMLKPKGIFKKIILGDYKASFGQGTGLWTGLSFSKSSDVIDIRRRAKGLEKYSSVNENSFLRGLTVEISPGNFSINLFGSYKKADASLNANSLPKSIRNDGYHRTATELLSRKNIHETMFGGIVKWQSRSVKVEAGQTYRHTDKPLTPQTLPYKQFAFSGDTLFTTFAGYNWFGQKLILFGELTLQNFNNISFYQGLTFSPGADVQIALSYRNYSRSYFSIQSNPFAEASTMNGESGFYTAISFQPLRRLSIKTYFDIFSYKWLEYRTDSPSYGHDYLLRGDYSFSSGIFLTLRYRNRTKQRNRLFYNSNDFPLSEQTLNSVRFQINYPAGNNWRLSSRIEQTFFREDAGHHSKGFLFYLDVKHTFAKNKLTADARITHFDTDDYYSRIYTCEPDVLYAFNIPAFMGNGVRFLFNLSYKPARKIQFYFRIANTHMPDANEIGSGYNAVAGKNLTEIKLQMRIKL